jgi:hypothetical protein
MITSGLVITLSTQANLAAQAVAQINARAEFMPGERNVRWLPVAMEARDDAESRDLHDWVHALPGVEYVDVVSVNFEEIDLIPAGSEQPPIEKNIRGRPESPGEPSALPVPALND